LEWEIGEPLSPDAAVFISYETEEETVERIKTAAEKSGMRVLKTDFPENVATADTEQADVRLAHGKG
jgi:hypothetical protein